MQKWKTSASRSSGSGKCEKSWEVKMWKCDKKIENVKMPENKWQEMQNVPSTFLLPEWKAFIASDHKFNAHDKALSSFFTFLQRDLPFEENQNTQKYSQLIANTNTFFPRETFHSRKNKIQQINLQFSPLHYLEVKNKIFVKAIEIGYKPRQILILSNYKLIKQT